MESRIAQAVILSAGLGTRLREVTGDAIPKVMVPIQGKPLLEWHIERLRQYGVKEFFVNLFYLPETIRDYFGDGSKWGVKIHYVLEEPEIRGTAGGVKNFSAEGGSASGGDGYLKDNFFVIYGDVFNLIDYNDMAEAFFKKQGAVAMEVVGDNDHPHDSDLVEIDEEMKFLTIHPKPHTTLPERYKAMRAAAFIFNKEILKYIPANTYYEIDHQLLPDLLARGYTIYGYECDKFIKDIGTPERYQAVNRYVQENKLG